MMTRIESSKALRRRPRINGFSLLELIVVLATAFVLAGVAIPNVIAAVSSVRLGSATSSTAALLQEMRLRAVSDDRNYTMRSTPVGPGTLQFADLNANGVFDNGEPSMQVAAGVTVAATDAPSLSSMALDFTPQSSTTSVSFNARGVPCVVSGFSCKTNANGKTVGFAYFLSTRVKNTVTWTAISVSPSGRLKTWIWTGASWKQR